MAEADHLVAVNAKCSDNHRSTGNTDMARKKYQEVIDQFPKSAWAETASKAIGELGN